MGVNSLRDFENEVIFLFSPLQTEAVVLRRHSEISIFFWIVCLAFRVIKLRIRALQQNGENRYNHKEILNKPVGKSFQKIYDIMHYK